MTIELLAIGFVSLIVQVVLLRELAVAFQGSELNYLLALGVWLLGTASGAFRRGAEAPRSAHGVAQPPSRRAIAGAFLLAGLLPALAIPWARGARHVLGAVPGAFLPFPSQMLVMALALWPVAFVFGLLFRRVAERALAGGRPLAASYALECAGALAGGAAATLAHHAGLSNLATGLAAALVATAVAWSDRRGPALSLGAVIVLALATAGPLDRALTAWNHPGLVATRDTPYGRVTITDWGGQLNVFVNDALAYETGGTAAEEFVTVAALVHPAPRRILVLGGGMTGLVREALAQDPAQVVNVELDPAVAELVVRHLPAGDPPAPAAGAVRAAGLAARVRTVHDDPRRYLARSADRHDLILVGMPEPASGQANRYYTREFFAECAARLAPGGVLALRLPAAENAWSPPLVARTASIDRALRAAFADVLVLPGATAIALGSNAPIARDPDLLAARLAARGLAPRLVSPAYLRFLFTNDRTAELALALTAARVPMNRDAHPVCYRYTLALWLSRFYPAIARLDAPPGARWPIGGAALAGLAGLWLATRRRSARGAIAVFFAGAIGMVLESILLLAYQARGGVLYQDLGLLLMLFMAGLALGAAAIGRLPRPAGRRQGIAIGAGLALASSSLAFRLATGGGPGLVETAGWLVVAGALTAAVFAEASGRAADPAAAIGLLYGADLAGGALGSLAASLVLIPILGLAPSALLAAGAAVLALAWL